MLSFPDWKTTQVWTKAYNQTYVHSEIRSCVFTINQAFLKLYLELAHI